VNRHIGSKHDMLILFVMGLSNGSPLPFFSSILTLSLLSPPSFHCGATPQNLGLPMEILSLSPSIARGHYCIEDLLLYPPFPKPQPAVYGELVPASHIGRLPPPGLCLSRFVISSTMSSHTPLYLQSSSPLSPSPTTNRKFSPLKNLYFFFPCRSCVLSTPHAVS